VSIVDNFYNELFVLVVTFTLLFPQFCNLPYISIIQVTYALFENVFLYSEGTTYLFEMFGVVLLLTFVMPVIYHLFITVVVVSYLYVYLSC